MNEAGFMGGKTYLRMRALSVWRRLRYYPRLLHAIRRPLDEFKRNVYSQNGEDGIIAELFRRIGIHTGWVVEFGAWDGKYLSNTYRIIHHGETFRAVYIEGDSDKFLELKRTAEGVNGRIIPIHAFVQPTGETSLDNVLGKTPLPVDFELLSIDVDSIDYQIWQGLKHYSPKIVVIEINSSLPPDEEQIHGEGALGASFKTMVRLGQTKGYTCVSHTGNLIFVRNDLAPMVRLEKKYLNYPELLFCSNWLSGEALARYVNSKKEVVDELTAG